jgi:hypothetical protein
MQESIYGNSNAEIGLHFAPASSEKIYPDHKWKLKLARAHSDHKWKLKLARAQDAVDHYDMALQIAVKQELEDLEGRLYHGLAAVYFDVGEKEEALRFSKP